MYVQQHVLDGLGCLSYVIGDEGTGAAAVVDPQVAVREYVRDARGAGLRIEHVMDTHVHADHLSGARALAAATGATVHAPADADARYPHERLEDGAEIRLGDVMLRIRNAPGHTPEHVIVEVRDAARGTDTPYAVLTGDTLFAGSVGRPDLEGTMDAEDLAGRLHATMRDVLAHFPAGTLLYAGHGAGSACGANISTVTVSTLGYERDANPFLAHESRDAFVRHVTAGLPPAPGNARNLKRLNREDPPAVPVDADAVESMGPDAFADTIGDAREVLLLDTREPDAFAANHVPGAVNVPVHEAAFPARVARLLEWGLPVYLVTAEDADVPVAVTGLARVGGLDVRGHLAGGAFAWRMAGHEVGTLDAVDVHATRYATETGNARLLDVRSRSEWQAGHAPGATWVRWQDLDARLDELDPRERWLVACGSGYRSSIAASVLARAGYDRVGNVLGGMTAWKRAGFPMDPGSGPEAAARSGVAGR